MKSNWHGIVMMVDKTLGMLVISAPRGPFFFSPEATKIAFRRERHEPRPFNFDQCKKTAVAPCTCIFLVPHYNETVTTLLHR